MKQLNCVKFGDLRPNTVVFMLGVELNWFWGEQGGVKGDVQPYGGVDFGV